MEKIIKIRYNRIVKEVKEKEENENKLKKNRIMALKAWYN